MITLRSSTPCDRNKFNSLRRAVDAQYRRCLLMADYRRVLECDAKDSSPKEQPAASHVAAETSLTGGYTSLRCRSSLLQMAGSW
jgi:hypothetical protein